MNDSHIAGLTTIASNFSPRETMDRLENEIRALGLTVFARIDHAEGAKEVGLELRPTELIIFGNARGGTPLMQSAQTAGIDLPLKVLVRQDSAGKTWLSYNEPGWISDRHQIANSELIVDRLATALSMIARKAAAATKYLTICNKSEGDSMSQRLTGKIALITGGSSGLGLATAQRFIAEGAYVFITGRRQQELDVVSKQLGNNATGIRSDISNMADLDRLFAAIQEQKGRLDILFANAGGGAFVPLDQVTEEHFDKYFGINVKGTLFTVQKAVRLMTQGGAIVINGSMVSIKGVPAFGVYAATKAALRSFARTWTMDLKGRNIRVNVVSPGMVVTPGYKSELGMNDEQVKEFEAQAAATTPLGRTGTPDEIAKAVVFLASDESSYINGVELFVDGGAAQI